MQVVEVRVRDQYKIDRREITNLHPGLAQSFKHKKPAREVRIDDNVLPTHLQEETGVPNKSHSHLGVGHQNWLVGLANSGGHSRMADELPKLARALAHCRTLERLSQHRGRCWLSLARQ